MKSVFLDTSFLLALVLLDDEHHERAVAWQKRIAGPFATTEYVLVELADALCASADLRRVVVATVEMLRNDAQVRIISASTTMLEAGLEFFAQRPDKR